MTKIKHRATEEQIARVEAWIDELCARQGITREELYQLPGGNQDDILFPCETLGTALAESA